MSIEIKVVRGYSMELVEELYALEIQIFDQPYSKEKLNRESSVKPNLISLVAYSGKDAIGYKVGYEMTSRLFYSWMGGVLPASRKKGVARKLMEKQHEIVKEGGYKVVRTYTENQYRDMLILNIRTGFDVVGTLSDSTKPKTVIILDKLL